MSATADRRSQAMGGDGYSTERERFDARHGWEDDRSVGQIVGDLVSHSQELMRGEIAFAKREVAESAKQVGGAAGIGAAALPFAMSAVALLGVALALALAEAMPGWLAFLIVTVLYLAIAAGLALVARARFKEAQLAPTHAIETAKEDLSWIKAHRG